MESYEIAQSNSDSLPLSRVPTWGGEGMMWEGKTAPSDIGSLLSAPFTETSYDSERITTAAAEATEGHYGSSEEGVAVPPPPPHSHFVHWGYFPPIFPLFRKLFYAADPILAEEEEEERPKDLFYCPKKLDTDTTTLKLQYETKRRDLGRSKRPRPLYEE